MERSSTLPLTRDLVLIGGGHAHALVLEQWIMSPLPGARLTVINPGPTAPYSGMLPGHIAGHYSRDALDIDLVKIARRAGARLVMDAAVGIDPDRKTVALARTPEIAFDVASVDVGITSAMPTLPGFAEHGTPAKPLGPFAFAWERYLATTGPASIVVIGGGVAGAELALAMAYRLRQAGRTGTVRLLDQARAFTALGEAAGQKLRNALSEQGVTLLEHSAPQKITEEGVLLADGRLLNADFVTGAAGAKPHDWLARTPLANARGFINVDPCLRSTHPEIYAVGDCAEMVATPRPKAGVYAVRQAPILYHNLRAALSGRGKQRPYKPQKDYLKLISLGRKSALVEKYGLTFAGPLLWSWKDRIDQGFMARFDTPEHNPAPDLPDMLAAGVKEAFGDKPLCGGCGSKLGAAALVRGLGEEDTIPGDDAALLQMGKARQVISTDHLRAMTNDPVTLTRIAATHALGDIWAMGARPQAALASITLPRQTPDLAGRSLSQIMETARAVMEEAGAEIKGGHSSMGAEMSIGFTVTGLCDRAPITLNGAQPGDRLILTKPIGSGVIMAAEMQGQARGEDVQTAYRIMSQPQGTASQNLAGANAMTDVTGFGLIGHLHNMITASGTGARIIAADVPLLPGALALSEQGHRSTLYPENRALLADLPQSARTDLFFDPQTGGGLLAALPRQDAEPVLAALLKEGYQAALIGKITDEPGHISID